MNKAEQIANKARESLSEFCINECSAYCCRKGYLILNEDEIPLFSKAKEHIKSVDKNQYSLFLGNKNGCPNLNGSKCKIHKEKKRPKTCKDFPIFISGNNIKISDRCPAKKANKFYPYIRELIELGYKVI